MEIHQKKPTCNVFLKRFAVCGCFVFNKERNKGKKQMNKNKTKQRPVSLTKKKYGMADNLVQTHQSQPTRQTIITAVKGCDSSPITPVTTRLMDKR